jgi:hypothetical protein
LSSNPRGQETYLGDLVRNVRSCTARQAARWCVVTRHPVHEELRAAGLTPRSTAGVWNGKRTVSWLTLAD